MPDKKLRLMKNVVLTAEPGKQARLIEYDAAGNKLPEVQSPRIECHFYKKK